VRSCRCLSNHLPPSSFPTTASAPQNSSSFTTSTPRSIAFFPSERPFIHGSKLNLQPLLEKEISSGSVLDYAVENCLDSEGNVRCTKPFLVSKSTCYDLSWSTEGTISHTTIEVRDAGSDELVYYRDTNGQWTPDKGEVSPSVHRSIFKGGWGLRVERGREIGVEDTC